GVFLGNSSIGGVVLYRLKGFKADACTRMHEDRRIMLSGRSVAAGRASAKNKQFYHDRCIAATPSKFLLQESKYGLAGAKSPCYSQPEVAISNVKKPMLAT